MDVIGFIVIILISPVFGKKVQPAKKCEEKPKNVKCTTLQVEQGTACYNGKFPSVSCSEGYSFNKEIKFECKKKHKETFTWSPADKATCSCIETTACLTSMSSTCMTSMPTTIDASSSVKMYSTTHVTHTDKTESVDTTYFESTLLPSESSIFSTSMVSATQSMTTPILQSETFTEIPTISVSEMVTSKSVSASTQPVPAMSKEAKGSDVTVVYITVPVVICIIALIVAIIFLYCRQKRRKSVLKREKPSSSVINKAYENTIERHCSLINVRKSRDSGYAEIPLEFLQTDEASGSVYQTIDNLPEDQIGKSKTYGHLKQNTRKFIDMNYSHIDVNKPTEKSVTDPLYDHSDKTPLSNESKDMQDDGDTTYNRLNITPTSMTVIDDIDKVDEDTDTEYNHAKAGDVDIENKADTYSHLNGTFKTSPTSTRQENQLFHNNENRTKLPNIQPYEFAKDTKGVRYEFAKEVENFNSVNNNGADKSVKQELKDLTNECIDDQGYETPAGFSHTYFVLEPEEPLRSNEVVGDISSENGDTSSYAESPNHQYFTLEKTDT